MSQAFSDDDKPLNPQAERAIAKVRWLMLIASVTTFVAIGAVLLVIGYRVFHAGGSAPPVGEVAERLPKGARVLSATASGDRLVVTIDIGGSLEVRVFDLTTLKPVGRLTFPTAP
jgi:hypothetical protein